MKKALIITSVVLNIALIAGGSIIGLNAKSFLDNLNSKSARFYSQFDLLSSKPVSVVFLGDSITEEGHWHELFPGINLANRGIGGDTTENILDRIEQVFKLKPEKLFVMIGINDLNRRMGPKTATSNYTKLFDLIDQNIPATEVYIQSVLPVNDTWKLTTNTHIPSLNRALKDHADKRGYTYIDLHSKFADSSGQLTGTLSNDGIHLLAPGYDVWRKEIMVYFEGDR